RRDRGGAVGRHELGRARPLRHRLSGDRQPRLAQGVGGVLAAAGAARAAEGGRAPSRPATGPVRPRGRRPGGRRARGHRHAHLFEHLMFQGSKNVPQDQHQAFIASIGGESNASTNEDSTNYWETVPAHYLPLALWLEADRMASLKVEQSAFTRERSVVKEER